MSNLNQQNELELLAVKAALLIPLGQAAIRNYIRNGQFGLISVTRGTTIHFEGEVCLKMEIILAGEIIIERIDAFGNLMTVARCYQDDVLGGNLLFSKNPFYPMTLSAAQDTVLLSIDRNLLFELLSQFPPFLRLYLQFSSDRASMLGEQIRHYVNKTIRMCIINFIKQEYEQQKINPIHLNLSKKKLAEKIGVQRTSISRELAKMRQEGLINYDKNSLTIINDHILK